MDNLKENWKEWLLNIFIMFVVFSIGFFSHYLWVDSKNKKEKLEILKKEKIFNLTEKKEKELKNKIFSEFSNLDLKAEAILVKKFSDEEIYSKNKNSILPIASLTKIFNSIISLENKNHDEEIVLTKRSLQAEGNYNLYAYEKFSLEDAVSYMMIGSINDIASALSFGEFNITENWKKFLSEMNIFAKNNSMNSTIFFSENGLNITSHIMGAYSTAEDIEKVVKYFYEKFPKISKKTVLVESDFCSDKKCHYVKNTNLILEKYPEIKFSKTGYTKLAGGSLAVVLEINSKKYSVVILNSTKQGRFNDLEKIILQLKKL